MLDDSVNNLFNNSEMLKIPENPMFVKSDASFGIMNCPLWKLN